MVRKVIRATREQRRRQIADTTLKLIARYGVQGATISRIASGIGLTRSALYKFFPNREAMLEGALDLLVERVPRWIDQSSGRNVYEHLMDMGRQHAPLGRAEFESFIRPWFQLIAASSVEHMTHELSKRQLMFVQDFALLVERGKRDGSIREDVDSNLVAWALMMWGWADDVARLVGLEQVMGAEASIEIFRRMIGDIAGPSQISGDSGDEREDAGQDGWSDAHPARPDEKSFVHSGPTMTPTA
jgi:AcrR family transcriptional regulator